MKERPILMTAENVRRILAGQKSQTRRVAKPQPHPFWQAAHPSQREPLKCPHGKPGDRLWVRESFRFPQGGEGRPRIDRMSPSAVGNAAIDAGYPRPWCPTRYEADDTVRSCNGYDRDIWGGWGKLRPGIHMPRWASRIDLEITDVRVQRVQEISVEDIIAEGLSSRMREHDACCDLREQWRELWESINGKRPGCTWADNPYVWAISFRRVEEEGASDV